MMIGIIGIEEEEDMTEVAKIIAGAVYASDNETALKNLRERSLKLCKKYPSVHYLNMESDTSYIYDDFFNETHLSEIGAEKFTMRLNNYIKGFLSE